MQLTRRKAISAGLSVAALPWRPAPAQAARCPYLGDMHSHYGMFMPRLFGFDLRKPGQLREGHYAELHGARQRARARIAAEALHDARQARP